MSDKRPNIVLFMCDQLVPMLTGAYGCEVARTPNIDRIAARGVTFENAYTTCPVCVPARVSLMTGRYVADLECYDNASMVKSDIPTFAHYLNIAGFDTVLSGKGHFIGPDQMLGFQKRLLPNVYPTSMVFMPKRDEDLDYSNLHPNPIAVDYLAENVGVVQYSQLIDYDEEAVFQAIRYLGGKRSKPSYTAQEPMPERDPRPFFLKVSINHPHEPFHVLQEFWDLYDGVKMPIPVDSVDVEPTLTSMDRSLIRLHGSDRVDVTAPENLEALYRAYLGAVSYADSKLGQILDALERFGLADDTIVVFTADHGDMLGHRGMVQKRAFYDYSTRIPLIVTFPGNLPVGTPGSKVTDPVSITDVAPTILEMAGVREHLPMDGQSLVRQITGESDAERCVFCENYSEGVSSTCLMVRKGNYKYTYIHGGERQLFNCAVDPEERNNLAGLPEYEGIEQDLLGEILRKFDPEEINHRAQDSYERRLVIRESMRRTGLPEWDYAPKVDPTKIWWRPEY